MSIADASKIDVDRSRRVFNQVEQSQLMQAADQSFLQMVARERSSGNLVAGNDSQATKGRLAARVLQRLAQSVYAVQAGVGKIDWQVQVVRNADPQIITFASGKLLVHTGLLDTVSDEPELAAVMAHHMAHVLLEHYRERANDEILKRADTDIQALSLRVSTDSAFSRLHEQEADRVGSELMARAGYDPRVALSIWPRVKSSALANHGSSQSRIQDLSNYASRYVPLFEASRRR
jgi:predicted Zn-dependent protease